MWKSLDLPADEALEKLLGRRVLIAWRWAEVDGGRRGGGRRAQAEPDWVVLSLVSRDAERRIRAKLRPAPREVHAGQAILALEDGRFLLTTRVLERDGGAIVMLAPAAHVALFKDMLPRFGDRTPGARLGDDPTLAGLAGLLDADIAMLTLGPGYAEAAANGGAVGEATAMGVWWRLGEELARRGAGLDGKLVRLGGSAARMGGSVTGLAPGQIDALAEGALLAVADLIPREPLDGAPSPLGAGGGVHGGDGGQGVRVVGDAEVTPNAAFAPRAPRARQDMAFTIPRGPNLASMVAGITEMLDLRPEDGHWAVAGETIAVVHGSGRRDDRLSITLGVSSDDLSRLAPSADRLMAWLLAAPAGDSAGGAGTDVDRAATLGPDFGGAFPPAVRVAEVPEASMARLGGLLGQRPVIAWQFAPMVGAVPGEAWAVERLGDRVGEGGGADAGGVGAAGVTPASVRMVGQGLGRPSPWAVPGWWVVRLEQSPDGGRAPAALRDVSGLLVSPRVERSVVTAGVLRPAQLLGALAALGVPMPPAMGAMRWVQRVRWEGDEAEPGRLVVELAIDLDPTMGAPP